MGISVGDLLREVGESGVATLEGEFGDAALVEATEAEGDHAVELLFGGAGERHGETGFRAEDPGDGGVFGGVSAGEEAGVVAVLHVLAVGLEDLRVGARLGKHFAQHGEIEPERGAEAEALGKTGGVDVHDHVDEGFYLGGLAGGADVTKGGAEVFENGLDSIEGGALAGAHQIERSVTGLGNGRSHTALQADGADGAGAALDLYVDLGCERGAVDEGLALGAKKQRVAGLAEDGELGGIVSDDRDDHISGGGDGGEGRRVSRANLGGEGGGAGGVDVVDGGHGVVTLFETAGHVGAHATDSDEGDFFSRHIEGCV